jgi:hypothetical protein
VSRDDDGRPREKLSWREVDRRRSGARPTEERRPQSPADQARAAAAAKAYTKQLDAMFIKGKGGAEGDRLARAMRDARGTPEFAGACRAYRDVVGLPEEPAQLALFLDSGDPELILPALAALGAAHAAGKLQATSGLRTQLRLLAQDPNDAVAEDAEALLAAL